MTLVRLVICVTGIYASFLSWALVQERLSTTPYDDPLLAKGSKPQYFRSVVFLNTVQSCFSCLAAFTFLILRKKPGQSIQHALALQTISSTSSSTSPSAFVDEHGHKVKANKEGEEEDVDDNDVEGQLGNGSASYVSTKLAQGQQRQRQQNNHGAITIATTPTQLTTPTPTSTTDLSSRSLLKKCLQCAILHSIGSPFGFASLRHINFPTMILGKSCKLVPVMLMNIVLYRRRFALHKYVVVGMVTLGISLFMLYAPTSHSHNKMEKGSSSAEVKSNSLLGLSLLLINLLIDGATNSTQDDIFAKFKISGCQLMFIMNGFATVLTTMALIIPFPSLSILNPTPSLPTTTTTTNELIVALQFIKIHPTVIRDILLFSLTGAIGQLFIFETLSHFGSLTLVTITVTRKLFTMLLSVFVFNHQLTFGQWLGVATVFSAIALEAYVKLGHGRAIKIIQETSKAKVKEM